jgi:hypothetical protein
VVLHDVAKRKRIVVVGLLTLFIENGVQGGITPDSQIVARLGLDSTGSLRRLCLLGKVIGRSVISKVPVTCCRKRRHHDSPWNGLVQDFFFSSLER